ncbi:restriction endonuclease subunit S [Pseudoalteromonas sp. NFXS39]|uniref:restriction endonuclease subunit S n=1 Tax=Pseudoalteromonas sp. NFXS39 TaxID=2818437 RepID=UPI0032E01946
MSFFTNSAGWPLVPLKEVATLKRGYDLPTKNRVEGDVPIYAANGQNGFHNEVKIQAPGVITGRSGTIGKVHYTEEDYWPLNTALYVTDFHGNYPKWVYYMLQAFKLERFVEGAGVPTLNRNLVHDELIPLPPLEEQKRIAAILDKADSVRRKRQQAIDLADDFLRSVFLDMFGADLQRSINVTKFGDVSILDAKMVDPREEEYLDLLHIGPDRIEKGTGKLLPALTAREEKLISKKFLFDEQYILYSKIRPYLRKVALPDFRAMCSADMYPVKPVQGKVTREFIWMILLSGYFDNYVSSLPARANIPKLNKTELAGFEFSLPEFSKIEKFSEIVKHCFERSKTISTSCDESESLFNSLSQKAFAGEL